MVVIPGLRKPRQEEVYKQTETIKKEMKKRFKKKKKTTKQVLPGSLRRG